MYYGSWPTGRGTLRTWLTTTQFAIYLDSSGFAYMRRCDDSSAMWYQRGSSDCIRLLIWTVEE